MSKVSEVIKRLQTEYKPDDFIFETIWSKEDVHQCDASLTDEQVYRVLELIEDSDDAAKGVTWDTIEDAISIVKKEYKI
jgi:hypothetical protein